MEEYITAISRSELAELSKKQYISYLSYADAEFGGIDKILREPEQFYANLIEYGKRMTGIHNRLGLSNNTLYAYVSAIIASQRHTGKFVGGVKIQWSNILAKIMEPIKDKINTNAPGDKVFIPFDEICKIRDILPDNCIKLLIGMYTYIPPLRSDFARIQLVEADVDDGDFININTGKLVVRAYKTHKKYGDIDVILPDELMRLVKLYPCGSHEWLFLNREDKAFNAWANRQLSKIFGNGFTITSFRHSYLSAFDFGRITLAERTKIAKMMGHSVAQQTQYQWFAE